MPIFQLTPALRFPDPNLAEDGLLAVGGDLSTERLLLAYSSGIFPWYSRGEPILWWSPDPRTIITPDSLHVSRSLQRTLTRGTFRTTLDTAFPEVIRACAQIPRRHEHGTWITLAMIRAYCALHDAGFAHSIECWVGDALVGGLYGVSLGGCFFGESMFSRETNASKVALVTLVRQLETWGIDLLDCQLTTSHLLSLGAYEVPRTQFLTMVKDRLTRPTRPGPWSLSP
jgi:leucyl/phenylalanyl-tRNA--protein transferase